MQRKRYSAEFKREAVKLAGQAGMVKRQVALDCWHSPEYQRAAKLRQPVSTIDLVIVEGYEGPQPG